jgi:hypothetical protein
VKKLNVEGTFRGRTLGPFRLIPPKEGKETVMAAISFAVEEEYDANLEAFIRVMQEGAPLSEHYEAEALLCIVKKDGSPNEVVANMLAESLGWNGEFDHLESADMQDVLVQFDVKRDDYNGKTNYRATWLRPWGAAPRKSTNPEVVKSLNARYGPAFRAIAGNAKRNAPPVAVAPQTADAVPVGGDDIPF